MTGDAKNLAQEGSEVTIDGAAEPTQAVDVARLYETIMRKDGRR